VIFSTDFFQLLLLLAWLVFFSEVFKKIAIKGNETNRSSIRKPK